MLYSHWMTRIKCIFLTILKKFENPCQRDKQGNLSMLLRKTSGFLVILFFSLYHYLFSDPIGLPELDEEMFSDAMFAAADIWVPSLNILEYINFFERCMKFVRDKDFRLGYQPKSTKEALPNQVQGVAPLVWQHHTRRMFFLSCCRLKSPLEVTPLRPDLRIVRHASPLPKAPLGQTQGIIGFPSSKRIQTSRGKHAAHPGVSSP